MQVFYSLYHLTPVKKANRLSTPEKKTGVYLKIRQKLTNHFADFFPHIELGDESVDSFLENFKFQNTTYQQKVFYFLLQEEKLRTQNPRPILNHELWDGKTPTTAPVIKYKLQDPKDQNFLHLPSTIKIRLDANGCFDEKSWNLFFKELPTEKYSQIEYIEDPMPSLPWPSSPIPWAKDFIDSKEASVLIHKPNRGFLKTNQKTIFSSYLGSDLGLWHSYLELLKHGDLGLYHGIITRGFYQEERGIFLHNNLPNLDHLKSYYLELENLSWKSLCSI